MTRPWWRGAAFYEIYVRSFADSNDDGIGDLPGITSRLDHVKRLGADAVWLTPFYPSPQKDQGYDVANYYDVNPEYGTLADFDQLVASAHDMRLKVLVDLVPNHTSDQHPWFQAALSSPDDPHRDLLLQGRQTRRLASEQLAVGVRRPSLDERRAQRPVVPAPLRTRAARPRLVGSPGTRRVRAHRPLLARPRSRRLSHRRGVRPLQAQRPRRRADGREPRDRRAPSRSRLRRRRSAAGARGLSKVAADPQRVPARPCFGRRDLRAATPIALHPSRPAEHGVRVDPSALGREPVAAIDRSRHASAAWTRGRPQLDAFQSRRRPPRDKARRRLGRSGPRPCRAAATARIAGPGVSLPGRGARARGGRPPSGGPPGSAFHPHRRPSGRTRWLPGAAALEEGRTQRRIFRRTAMAAHAARVGSVRRRR